MDIAKASLKGQVLIPVSLRRKYNIQKGSRLAVLDGNGTIVLKPMLKDPIEQGCGMLKKAKGPSPLKYLLQEHRKEARP